MLTIKEEYPYSKVDGSIDTEFVLIRKNNKSYKILKPHDLVKTKLISLTIEIEYFFVGYITAI